MAKKKMPKASKVKVTKADGTVEIRPAYDRIALYKILGNDKLTRKLRNKGQI